MSKIDGKILQDRTLRSTNYRRRGAGLLIGFGFVMAFWLITTLLGFHSPLLPSLCVSLGGWLLICSAVSFSLSDPGNADFDGACGAIVGAWTMGLLLAGWTSPGQTLASVLAGGFLGAVVGVPLGWTLRAIRSKFRRSAQQVDPAPVDLRDPWIDP